jgi:hypothetical protein
MLMNIVYKQVSSIASKGYCQDCKNHQNRKYIHSTLK